jgi:YidC/Oxa1 family membrane protein insertase
LNIWDLYIVAPLVNVLIVLSHYLFSSFGLTIIVFTILVRAAMYPLTIKQLKATKAMQSIQGQLAELQKKYAKDRQTLAQEQMKLYRKSGMNPAGCILPMLIQMPIWIALYQAIIKVLGAEPENFLELSKYLYSSWTMVFSQVPLGNQFLWLDLSSPDKFMIMPILTAVSMWVQQKMSTLPSPDPAQQQQSQLMLWMMPLMFFVLSLQFPSGLTLYWVVSNIIGIVMQYLVTGWGGLTLSIGQKKITVEKKNKEPGKQPSLQLKESATEMQTKPQPAIREVKDGESGGTREDGRRSNTSGTGTIGTQPGRSRGHRHKRR